MYTAGAGLILGVGHVGIHLTHRREVNKKADE